MQKEHQNTHANAQIEANLLEAKGGSASAGTTLIIEIEGKNTCLMVLITSHIPWRE